MDKNYQLMDIYNSVMNFLKKPVNKILMRGVANVGSALSPYANIGNIMLSGYNDYKLAMLLIGLSSEFNLETRLNELYAYVNSGEENAITVANLFRKTLNAECPKACIIYGLVLATHTQNKTPFSQDELVMCRALENATDYDLDNLNELMSLYIKETPNGNRISFPKEFQEEEKFVSTCDWAVYNRIFTSHLSQWEDIKEGCLVIDTPYYLAGPAMVLFKYLIKVKNIWNY